MNSAETLERIDAHQTTVKSLACAMLAAVHTQTEQANERFEALRARMVRALREYQVFKHREIFDPAIEGAAPAQAEAARGMKASCIAAGDACDTFFRTWSKRDLSLCWEEHVAATRELIAGLHAHLTAEREAIATALDETARAPAAH